MRRLLLLLLPVALIWTAPAGAARASLEVHPAQGRVGTQVTLSYAFADPADACPDSHVQFLMDDVTISAAPLTANGCTSTLVTQVPQTSCRTHVFQAYIVDGAPQSSYPGSEASAPFRVLCPTASPTPRPSRTASRAPSPSASPTRSPRPSTTTRATPSAPPRVTAMPTSPAPVITQPPSAEAGDGGGAPLWPWLVGGALALLASLGALLLWRRRQNPGAG
jgi:hypothetical protein